MWMCFVERWRKVVYNGVAIVKEYLLKEVRDLCSWGLITTQ